MRKEFKIGLTGICALIILYFGINYLKGMNMFATDDVYYVEFEDVNGLALSSPVFAQGVKVGIVQDIKYNNQKPGSVLVEISVDKQMLIPKGSTSELVTEMLGTVKMNLLLNKDSHEFMAPGETLEGKANYGLMGAAEKEILPQLQKTILKIDSVLTSLNKVMNNEDLEKTIHNTQVITANLSTTTRELNKMMQNDFPAIISNINTMSANFATISNNLKDIDYAGTIKKVDATLNNVQLLTEKLNRTDNTLGLMFNDRSMYDNLNSATQNAALLLEDLKAHPKRYVHFSLFGKKGN